MKTAVLTAAALVLFTGLAFGASAQNQKWTGSGGKGDSITIYAPQATGLEENQRYIPALVQGEFVSNFSNYSDIYVLDWERLDDIYLKLFEGKYDDNAEARQDLGHLTPTTYFMSGNITKTSAGYNLQMNITKTTDKRTVASFSRTYTLRELDNLSGIRKASLELLPKMGVTLTANAREELAGAAVFDHVSAQAALARGVTAQRRGAEFEALSYYMQAAAYDPSLREAAKRSSTLNANISGIRIGDNARDDIAWRKMWIDRLTETERYFDNFNKTESMPYILFYAADDIKQQGGINYQNETVTMNLDAYLHGSTIWAFSVSRALQTVYDGLKATGRAGVWGLSDWPQRSVTGLNPFASKNNNFSVVFELLNSNNMVIGRQTLRVGGAWSLNPASRSVSIPAGNRIPLSFQNVKANDITSNLTIQVTSVNGMDAEAAAGSGVLQIRAVTRNEIITNERFKFADGEIQGFANRNNVSTLVIPNTIWGDTVTSIGAGAFKNMGLTSVTIPSSVTRIGREAFADNRLTSVIIPNGAVHIDAGAFNMDDKFRFAGGEIQGFLNRNNKVSTLVIPSTTKWGTPVTSIGAGAFKNMGLTGVTIPSSVTRIGSEAFSGHKMVSVTIPDGVTHIEREAFRAVRGYQYLKDVTIPNSVFYIGDAAFRRDVRDGNDGGRRVTIGAGVNMDGDPFCMTYDNGNGGYVFSEDTDAKNFYKYYRINGRKAGTYTYGFGGRWSLPGGVYKSSMSWHFWLAIALIPIGLLILAAKGGNE